MPLNPRDFDSWTTCRKAFISDTSEKTELGLPVNKSLSVEYTFTDDEGTQHRERDKVPADWPALTVRTRLGEHDCLFRVEGSRVLLEADPPLPEHWRVELGGGD